MENLSILKKIIYTKKGKNRYKLDSKKKSLAETGFDVGVGLLISTVLNFTILPYYVEGIANSDILTMLQISLWYTTVSLIRRFTFRRIFENLRNVKIRIRL